MRDAERYVVAIGALGTALEAEAKALADDLGSTAYEERLKLVGGVPAIVLTTRDGNAAQALVAKLRGRGHRAQLCRVSEVVPASAMILLRQFQLDDDALGTGRERLPWSDISALIRARHQRTATSVDIVKDTKFDLGRAIVTGGLMTRKTEKREVVTRSEITEQVLYLFRASGRLPWILREHSAHYGALGAALAPSAMLNFTIAVEQFRARASQARFDDTLLRRTAHVDVDLYAHLVATASPT
ncbi:MAG TPA: hypothetical protein VGG74_07130 [Kofleriaceae bacterium]|jgi:hypothetical protein